MLITIYSIFGASILSVVVVAICVHKKHVKEDKKAIEAAGGDKKAAMNRVTAFSKALDPDYEAAMRESRYSVQMKKGSGARPPPPSTDEESKEQLLVP